MNVYTKKLQERQGLIPSILISVIIPAYNASATLNKCLDAIAQSDDLPFEVIVVDDSSSDSTVQIARNHSLHPIVISADGGEGKPRGPGNARNTAASVAQGDILVFVDSDVVVHRDTLGKFKQTFAEDASIAAVFGSYDSNPPARTLVSLYKNLLHHYTHHRGGTREALTFWAGCGAVRRTVFQAAGGFDKSYITASIEDIDLGYRLRDMEYRIVNYPHIQATHLKRWTITSLVRTDILSRAVPWSKLLASRKDVGRNDLNIDRNARASAVAVLIGTLCLFAAIKHPFALLGTLVSATLVFLLNGDMFKTFAGIEGPSFAIRTFPLHSFYLFYSSLTYVVVTATTKFESLLRKVFGTRSHNAAVCIFFVSVMILSNSGGMFSGDPINQLRASTVLAITGHLGCPFFPTIHGLWIQSANGLYYEFHDIAGEILMYPCAWLAAHFAHRNWAAMILYPPLAGRSMASMEFSIIAAIGAYYVYLLFTLFWPRRTAFLLALAYAFATIYWVYSQASWDVILAAVGYSAVLYYSGVLLDPKSRDYQDLDRAALGLGTAAAFVCLSRFYSGMFLLTGLVILCFVKRFPIRTYVHCLVPILAALAWDGYYNALRTGASFQTAAIGHQPILNVVKGTPWLDGIYGLTFAPNRGLFVFAPIYLLLFIAPFFWRSLQPRIRTLSLAFGFGAIGYALVLAKLSFWASIAWGPRYLVPALPVYFLPVAGAISALWPDQRWRTMLKVLIFVSFVLNAAPVFVNFHYAKSAYGGNDNAYSRLPEEHIAVWRGLALACEGKPLPPAPAMDTPLKRSVLYFPDLWMARVWQTHSTFLRLLDIVVVSALLLAATASILIALEADEVDSNN